MTAALMPTVSGGAWPLLAPSAGLVDWRDVANALARICRFNGHLAEDVPAYSVAEHCCRVADILPAKLRLAGLVHDAHEAFIGDLTTPLKAALDALGAGGAVRELAARHDAALFAAAGLEYPLSPAAAVAVRHADLRLLATERRDLVADSPGVAWPPLPAPLSAVIIPWPWHKAADEWLARIDAECRARHRAPSRDAVRQAFLRQAKGGR